MMLSDYDIELAIKNGELNFEPFHKNWVRASGVTLHLGAELLKPKAGVIVDVKSKTTPEYQKIIIEDLTPYQLNPGEFVLGHTFQRVTVGNSLGFFIEGRSTMARLGLTVVQTAMIVYPGHRDRCVTLELANHGPNPILLYPRMKIARVAIFELKSASQITYDDKGKYRSQESVGRPIFIEEIMPAEELA